MTKSATIEYRVVQERTEQHSIPAQPVADGAELTAQSEDTVRDTVEVSKGSLEVQVSTKEICSTEHLISQKENDQPISVSSSEQQPTLAGNKVSDEQSTAPDESEQPEVLNGNRAGGEQIMEEDKETSDGQLADALQKTPTRGQIEGIIAENKSDKSVTGLSNKSSHQGT